MNQVNTKYNNLLGNSVENQMNRKRYLKNILKENIKHAIFTRPKSRRKSGILYSTSLHVEAMDAFCKSLDNYNIIFKTTFLIC